MSDLQIGLVIIGGLVIALVIAYNRLQEGRFRKRAEDTFGGDEGDALLEPMVRARAERIEPHIEPRLPAGTGETEDAQAGRVEPVGVLAAAPATDDGRSPIDYSIAVSSGQPLPRPALQQLLEALEGLGRQAEVSASLADGIWVPLASAPATVSQMRVALQLADRRGHVTIQELKAFRNLVSQWAKTAGGIASAPEVQAYLETAKDLDRFCAEVDVVVGLNVVAATGEPFPGSKVRSQAEAVGLRPGNGVFRCDDAQGVTLFTLENQQGERFDLDRLRSVTVSGLTLLLDVPRLDQGVKAFDRMVDTGRQLALALGGSLVDDNRTPVTETGLEQIRTQLRQIYAAMEARGIRAGSRLALRLFS
jgi:hypothetical protein